jgi:thioredoxin reductase (NADPH)
MKKLFISFSLLSMLCHALGASPNTAVPIAKKTEEHSVVILGGGVAALTAATYLARGGITPLVLTGSCIGGALTQSLRVQNWPGELEISGFDLTEKMRKQAEANGAIFRPEVVIAADFSKRPFLITTRNVFSEGEEVNTIQAQACIIALGATPQLLGVPGETGEKGYWSRGVYTCAVCDGAIYKDKTVAVVGGGDSALTEAHYLSNLAEHVYIIVRGNEFRAVEKQRIKEILSRPNVTVMYQTVVQEIHGDGDKVTQLQLQNTQSKKLENLSVDALFLAIGAKPNTELFGNQIEKDAKGYFVLRQGQETSIEGVYAVGDVADPEFKQAISAAGDAAKAALQAQKYLTVLKIPSQPAFSLPIGTASITAISSQKELERELDRWEGVVFIDFYSDFCGPCRTFKPIYEKWAKEFQGKIKFLKADAEQAQQLFAKYQIRAIPTLLILDPKGQVLHRSVGSLEISSVNQRLSEMREDSFIKPKSFEKLELSR